jgi:magnesium transporter
MAEENTVIDSEVEALIDNGKHEELSELLANWIDPEVADLILRLDKSHQILVYRALPRERAADVFSHFDPEDQDEILEAFTDADTRHLLANLSPDDRTAMLEELPAEVADRMMQLLSPEDLAESHQLLAYPEDSVGRMMTPDFLRIRPEWTCEQALAHIRKFGRDSEILNILYVTDEAGKLIDIVRMRRLIMAAPNAVIGEILNYRFVSLKAFDDREVAVEMIQRYDVNALPVVDSDGVLLGIVTVDDIFDVAEEEATEDIHKGAAVTPLDMNYSAAAPTLLFRKRIGWLVRLIFVNLISAAVISSYQEYLQTYVALVLFMPLLIASGGNTGAQSATLMVRAISTGDLKLAGWYSAVVKEVLVGLMLGVAMGVLTWLLGIYRSGYDIALIVGISMVSIVLVANIIGALLPFTLTRMKLDPAVASSPLITSMMDAIGLMIYFSIAATILP